MGRIREFVPRPVGTLSTASPYSVPSRWGSYGKRCYQKFKNSLDVMKTLAVRGLWFACILAAPAMQAGTGTAMNLAGDWRFALDRGDAGTNEHWFSRPLPDRIQLPGLLQAQGYGDEISTNTPWVLSLYDRFWYQRADYLAYAQAGKVKVPFVCQPPRHYLGAAWYQREIIIPEQWQGKRVALFLERPHWETTV